MDDFQLASALEKLDAYSIVRPLAKKPGVVTNLAIKKYSSTGAQETVVIKHIAKNLANRDALERYGKVKSAHLPQLLELLELPDELAVILEYLPGENLFRYVQQHGPLSQSQAQQVMDNLCDAAQCLASVGIVHRDIKPSNIILSFGGASLIDPGIARIPQENLDRDTTVLGSWGYAAPEQLGYAQTDVRSDVFSLGRVFAFLLTGDDPAQSTYLKVIKANRELPRLWYSAIKRACALEPSLRPENPQALRQLIDSALLATPKSQLQVVSQPAREQATEYHQKHLRPTSNASSSYGTREDEKTTSLLGRTWEWAIGACQAVWYSYRGQHYNKSHNERS